MSGPQKRAVSLAADGPLHLHEMSESIAAPGINDSGVVFFESNAAVPVVDGRDATEAGDDAEARIIDDWGAKLAESSGVPRIYARQCAKAVVALLQERDRDPVAVFDQSDDTIQLRGVLRDTGFNSPPEHILAQMTPRERTTFALRRAAVRYIAQIEPRSFEQIASDHGVTVAAVSRVYRDVLARIGCRQIFNNAEKRWKLAEAAKRTLNSRKAA